MRENRKFYLYCRHNSVDIRNELGMPDYSYKFVENYFRETLTSFGDVVEVSESSELPNALSSSDYLLVFAPPHEVPREYLSAAIPVFAWEYSTIPNEKLNDNDLWDWQNVLQSSRGAITHSSFTVEALEVANVSVPKIALYSPLYDEFEHLAVQEKPSRWTIDCEGLVWDSASQSDSQTISFQEVTYTYVFNPVDGRKRWEEAASGFVWAHRDNSNASLILKLIHKDQKKAIDQVREFVQQLGEMNCRVVIICGFLNFSNYEQLIRGSNFVVNTSCGEGQCLPLIEFMSAGVPAVSPRHTAMSDYINEENSFVVDHSWSWVPWPNDPRLRFRCMNYPIRWESLRDAFVSSYETATRDQELYKRMSDSARKTMFNICSKETFEQKFSEFLELLG
jgi:glycosyltransferase involved in cell wall biosynthesis